MNMKNGSLRRKLGDLYRKAKGKTAKQNHEQMLGIGGEGEHKLYLFIGMIRIW
jgi:hypothetical protein